MYESITRMQRIFQPTLFRTVLVDCRDSQLGAGLQPNHRNDIMYRDSPHCCSASITCFGHHSQCCDSQNAAHDVLQLPSSQIECSRSGQYVSAFSIMISVYDVAMARFMSMSVLLGTVYKASCLTSLWERVICPNIKSVQQDTARITHRQYGRQSHIPVCSKNEIR